MSSLTTWYVAMIAGAMLLALVALRWTRSHWARVLISGLFLGLLPVAFVAHADLLGRPRPITLKWLQDSGHPEQVAVLGADILEGKSICVMLKLPGEVEPRLFQMEWDQKMAEQLQGAMRDAQNNGTGTMMNLPFEQTWDKDKPRFYALPQTKLPEKGEDGGFGNHGRSQRQNI